MGGYGGKWEAIRVVKAVFDFVQEITLDLILGCGWMDTRLKRNETNDYDFIFNPNLHGKIWNPDLFIGTQLRLHELVHSAFFSVIDSSNNFKNSASFNYYRECKESGPASLGR